MQSIVAHIWLNNKGWYDQNASDTCNIIEYTCDIEVTDVSSLYALNVDYVYVTTFVQCMVAFQTNNNNKNNPSNQCLILNAWFVTYIPVPYISDESLKHWLDTILGVAAVIHEHTARSTVLVMLFLVDAIMRIPAREQIYRSQFFAMTIQQSFSSYLQSTLYYTILHISKIRAIHN